MNEPSTKVLDDISILCLHYRDIFMCRRWGSYLVLILRAGEVAEHGILWALVAQIPSVVEQVGELLMCELWPFVFLLVLV